MKYRKRNDIIKFLDVSIIISLNKGLNDFKRVLVQNAKYFQRNGVEVVILLDETVDEQNFLNFIEKYPFINFKIIINRDSPNEYNRCKALNVGIKAASFNYILILDPEVELVTDIVYQLRYVMSFYPKTFATSVVSCTDYEKEDIHELKSEYRESYVGVMVSKKDAVKIRGYDEELYELGIEDDQFCRRLGLLGLKKIKIIDAKVFYKSLNYDEDDSRLVETNKKSLIARKDIFYPKKAINNNLNWGEGFNEIIWSWSTHKSFSELEKHLMPFINSNILNKEICDKHYDIIALIQVRNDSKNIIEILPHLENYCDGVILLDDGSSDDSYKVAKSDKLLLKVKKKYKGYFDDLENRNDLLKLASFFKSRWFLFVDADERFDLRYNDIKKYINKEDVDVFRFHLIDLWDNPNTYRIDIPDRKNNGITTRARLFRNKGSMQIYINRELHFSVVPYSSNMEIAKILLLHYGNFSSEIREKKYKLYFSQDPEGEKNGFSYAFLKDEKVVLGELDKLSLDKIENQKYL